MIKYILSLKGIVILGLGAVVLGMSLLMAWSELGFTGVFPDWLNDLMTRLHLKDITAGLFDTLQKGLGADITKFLSGAGVSVNPNSTASLGDYGYAIFMTIALTAAGIAIMVIGREDAEEKTVLPVKK